MHRPVAVDRASPAIAALDEAGVRARLEPTFKDDVAGEARNLQSGAAAQLYGDRLLRIEAGPHDAGALDRRVSWREARPPSSCTCSTGAAMRSAASSAPLTGWRCRSPWTMSTLRLNPAETPISRPWIDAMSDAPGSRSRRSLAIRTSTCADLASLRRLRAGWTMLLGDDSRARRTGRSASGALWAQAAAAGALR